MTDPLTPEQVIETLTEMRDWYAIAVESPALPWDDPITVMQQRRHDALDAALAALVAPEGTPR